MVFNTKKMERAKFSSRLGIVLATAGSAVGLGNIWRFPYMTGQDGGAAFILIYVCCVLFLGIPCMVNEFIIGRHAASNTARAYRIMARGGFGSRIGYIGVVTGFIIMGYYVVVSGWCLQYVAASAMGHLQGTTQSFGAYFEAFSQDAVRPVLWAALFLVITHLIIIHGVREGIERASKALMPTLFVLLLVIVTASCLLPGAARGIEFLFKPDFGKVTGRVFLDALGQSFYSLSIGMGCICTYASYFSRQTKLVKSAVQISVIDSLVAILAGLMIFPAAFSVGISPDSGPSLIFITLPTVFQEAFSSVPVVWYVVSVAFYALLSLAALTSLISLHEVATAFVEEEMRLSRRMAATVVSVLVALIGIVCSLSMGMWSGFEVLGRNVFSLFDFLSGQILLPLGGMLTCILIGYRASHKAVREQYTNWGTVRGQFFRTYIFCVKYICPVAILLVFLNQFGWI